MKRFAALYQSLDETTKTNRKIEAMREYFAQCTPADGAWAVYFLSGRRFKRLMPTSLLRKWCAEVADIPDWLFEDCYGAVGDLAETIALLLPPGEYSSDESLTTWVEDRIQPLRNSEELEQRCAMIEAWNVLSARERFVFNKLVTGSFRVGVSQGLVIRALAAASGLETATIAHRMMGQWEPNPEFFTDLLSEDSEETQISRPYPFCLAHPLQAEPETLGPVTDWLVDWKWDGIRAQIIRRAGETFIWSRGEELILDRFPELAPDAKMLPNGTVLDGEIVAWKDGQVLPFGELQRRIGRKTVGKKLLTEVPVQFVAFDILESDGEDIRTETMRERRHLLETVLDGRGDDCRLQVSPLIEAHDWNAFEDWREQSRDRHVEGLMLKRADSPYAVGRTTGTWWKWKVAPYTCDAVLIYAQRGHGRRASLYTDYTFAVWNEGELVPFAKAYSGLTDAEIRKVDRFVRKNTVEKFGPVRSVNPELVFELAFENIQPSKRHKSGIAVRFPRMHRWRLDKKPKDADTLDFVKGMIPAETKS
ncbi:ATP-dependent DNA ligase [Thalassoroseus pseudoceratinae]|uniref:ATP-dependent DNA ligase n=1 Tax=Thalassoroseus pseudoceratinae TaxID=2713176 RepID=UPI001423C0CD|nr:ATP-dependent DNA ligase [Thalassoroseus pseudoceratinae]